jgi:hypothetical protein
MPASSIFKNCFYSLLNSFKLPFIPIHVPYISFLMSLGILILLSSSTNVKVKWTRITPAGHFLPETDKDVRVVDHRPIDIQFSACMSEWIVTTHTSRKLCYGLYELPTGTRTENIIVSESLARNCLGPNFSRHWKTDMVEGAVTAAISSIKSVNAESSVVALGTKMLVAGYYLNGLEKTLNVGFLPPPQ